MNYFQTLESPIGPLTLLSDGQALTGLYMNEHKHGLSRPADWQEDDALAVLRITAEQLREFFAGERRNFDLPLNATGTEFQEQCWAQLSTIPFGETWSYGEMSRRVGNPNASRAVGAANGRNPISIVVPCHRVIGSSGKLVGFGGGIPRKAALLQFERAVRFGESADEFWRENPLDLSRA